MGRWMRRRRAAQAEQLSALRRKGRCAEVGPFCCVPAGPLGPGHAVGGCKARKVKERPNRCGTPYDIMRSYCTQTNMARPRGPMYMSHGPHTGRCSAFTAPNPLAVTVLLGCTAVLGLRSGYKLQT